MKLLGSYEIIGNDHLTMRVANLPSNYSNLIPVVYAKCKYGVIIHKSTHGDNYVEVEALDGETFKKGDSLTVYSE